MNTPSTTTFFNYTVLAYFIYLPLVVLLTLYVCVTLFRNSKIFMMDIFNGREEIAMSTNNLFRIGFYLFNIGFALYTMNIVDELSSTQDLIEKLSLKVGVFCIYLGCMLFLNMLLFFKGKAAAKQRRVNHFEG
jgi:hypothetical protein